MSLKIVNLVHLVSFLKMKTLRIVTTAQLDLGAQKKDKVNAHHVQKGQQHMDQGQQELFNATAKMVTTIRSSKMVKNAGSVQLGLTAVAKYPYPSLWKGTGWMKHGEKLHMNVILRMCALGVPSWHARLDTLAGNIDVAQRDAGHRAKNSVCTVDEHKSCVLIILACGV